MFSLLSFAFASFFAFSADLKSSVFKMSLNQTFLLLTIKWKIGHQILPFFQCARFFLSRLVAVVPEHKTANLMFFLIQSSQSNIKPRCNQYSKTWDFMAQVIYLTQKLRQSVEIEREIAGLRRQIMKEFHIDVVIFGNKPFIDSAQ